MNGTGKGIGKSILEYVATPMIPLGADPAQMRSDQEPPKDLSEMDNKEKAKDLFAFSEILKGAGAAMNKGDEDRAKSMAQQALQRLQDFLAKKKEEGEGEHDHHISDEPPMEVSKSAIRTFHAFYIEGRHEDAAQAIADALSLSKDDGPTVSETSEVEWAEFLAEASATKFNFLRKSMLKFHTFLGTAKSSWEKLSDKQKESAVKFLQSKASKMATELKSLVGGLTTKSPPEKILMAAMMAYMFGIGLSGEGAVVPEGTEE